MSPDTHPYYLNTALRHIADATPRRPNRPGWSGALFAALVVFALGLVVGLGMRS